MAENTSHDLYQSLYTSLRELGLTDGEANLYVTSLKLGPTSIATLAEHLQIPRPNVYKVIAGLEKHGLAKFSERKRYARTFVVEPPTVVVELLRKKRESVAELDHELVSAMPDLLALYHQGESPTKIKIYQGKDQWMQIFFRILDETKGPISFFGSADAFIELISWDREQDWIDRRVERGIHINVLLTPSKDAHVLAATEKREMRTTKIYKGKLPFATGFMLYANKVIIWQPKAPLVLLVEDEYIVEMLRSVFELMWETHDAPPRE